MKSKVLRYLHIFCMFLIATTFVIAFYYKSFYSASHFEEILYSVKDGKRNADPTCVYIGVRSCLPFVVLVSTIFYLIFFKKTKNEFINKVQNKKVTITWILFGLSIFSALWSTSFFSYTYYTARKSDFIEDNYVDSRKVDVSFKEKRNLIVISVESLETSLFTKGQGGYWNYEVIPELYDLLSDEDALVFYNKDISEQVNMIQGSSWTTASIIANTSALPFKVNTSNLKNGNLMNGAYTLGELLKKNGYYNEVISAAYTKFGDLNYYFANHGDYEIVDVDTLSKFGFKPEESDKCNWGINDNYLFEISKERLTTIAEKGQPFNVHIITIDTHFIDGYIGDYSETKYKERYENAYATESKLLYEFIKWIKEQPFYENTTVVVMGDHLSMQSPFFRKRHAKERYVYNCILNPITKDVHNSGRIITALDTFPTLVSAIGGEIDGEKLGLGVNLFSNEMTLAEKYGINILNNELKKNSVFYKNKINS